MINLKKDTAPTDRRTQKKIETRERLLQAAFELFASNGILNTSTLQIAKAASTSHGTLFSHFPNRDDLVIAVVDSYGKRLSTALHNSVEDNKGLKDLLLSHIAALKEFEGFYAHLISEAPLLSPHVQNAIFLIQSGIASYLEKVLQRELRVGHLKNIELPMLLNSWLGLLHYYLINRKRFAKGPSVLAEQGDKLVNYIVNITQR